MNNNDRKFINLRDVVILIVTCVSVTPSLPLSPFPSLSLPSLSLSLSLTLSNPLPQFSPFLQLVAFLPSPLSLQILLSLSPLTLLSTSPAFLTQPDSLSTLSPSLLPSSLPLSPFPPLSRVR